MPYVGLGEMLVSLPNPNGSRRTSLRLCVNENPTPDDLWYRRLPRGSYTGLLKLPGGRLHLRELSGCSICQLRLARCSVVSQLTGLAFAAFSGLVVGLSSVLFSPCAQGELLNNWPYFLRSQLRISGYEHFCEFRSL